MAGLGGGPAGWPARFPARQWPPLAWIPAGRTPAAGRPGGNWSARPADPRAALVWPLTASTAWPAK
jgi:hypothetical protein